MNIEVVRDDITKESLDAGPQLLVAGAKLLGCRTGDAKATRAFRLPAKWVIHTVGPVWRGCGRGEGELLPSCYRRCVEVADEIGARSLAFPAISTGVYGFPAVRATGVELVRLVAVDGAAEGVLKAAL